MLRFIEIVELALQGNCRTPLHLPIEHKKNVTINNDVIIIRMRATAGQSYVISVSAVKVSNGTTIAKGEKTIKAGGLIK